jgi:hypothetical protein
MADAAPTAGRAAVNRTKAGLAALALLGYLLVPYRWALHARAADAAAAHRIRGEVAALDTRIAHARTVAADRTTWARRTAAVAAAFPAVVDVDGEVAQLRAIAAATGVHMTSITSDPPPAVAGTGAAGAAPGDATSAQSIDLRLQVQGPVAAIEAFLARLRGTPRLFTTTRAALDLGADPRAPATADVTAQVWTWPGGVR